jgi:hypothetical protein
LQHLRLLAELGPRELIDDHRPVAQFLQLVGESVGGDSVGSGVGLVIRETEVAGLGGLGPGHSRHKHRRQDD